MAVRVGMEGTDKTKKTHNIIIIIIIIIIRPWLGIGWWTKRRSSGKT